MVGTIALAAMVSSKEEIRVIRHGYRPMWSWLVMGNIIRLQCAVHVYVSSYTEHNIFLIKYV